MKIIIQSEDELIKVAAEALHILSNLRKFTRLWEETHGVVLKRNKKYYEEKADTFISNLQVPDHKQLHEIKIEINENTP